MTPRQRWLVLGSALAVTLALVVWTGEEAEEPVEAVSAPVPAESGRAAPPEAATGLPSGRPARGAEAPEIRDLFAQHSWYVPPPTPPAEELAPQAPALPFTYLGKLIEDGRITVYLTDGSNRNLAVRQGDVIDGTYKVTRISPSVMTFIYIPMNKQQTLDIGRAN